MMYRGDVVQGSGVVAPFWLKFIVDNERFLSCGQLYVVLHSQGLPRAPGGPRCMAEVKVGEGEPSPEEPEEVC